MQAILSYRQGFQNELTNRPEAPRSGYTNEKSGPLAALPF
jgi:hypothetical protein